jgi:hypothetical protein
VKCPCLDIWITTSFAVLGDVTGMRDSTMKTKATTTAILVASFKLENIG